MQNAAQDKVGVVNKTHNKMTKIYTNEQGHIEITLPVSKAQVTLRQPKGRDLKAIEVATNATDSTNIGLMMLIASFLITTKGYDLETIEDLDAEDIQVIGQAISTFRVFSQTKTK